MACQCAKCKARNTDKVVTLPSGAKRIRCDRCGEGIPPYANMQGAGFQSHTVDHEYMLVEGNHNFFMPVHLELCYQCYLKDFAANYPDSPLPVIANVIDFENVVTPTPPPPKELDPGYFVYTA